MKFKKRNGLYVPKHYMGCMGIEDNIPIRKLYPRLGKKSVRTPDNVGTSASQRSGGGSTVFSDTFTETVNTHIQDHGTGWVCANDETEFIVVGATDNVLCPSWYSTYIHHTDTLDEETWTQVGVTSSNTNVNDGGGVLARFATAKTGYGAALVVGNATTGGIFLERYNEGGVNALAHFHMTITSGVTYTVKITVSGVGATVTVKGLVDGTERISYDDTHEERVVTDGYGGILARAGSGGGDIYFDNYSVGNL